MPEVLDKPPTAARGRVNLFTLPNQLTALRFVLSLVLFLLLALCDVMPERCTGLLNGGFWVFMAATVTDLFDGWVARRTNTVTVFGRMMDPFVDKVLVCGAMVFLSSGTFMVERQSVTGLAPWMVALVLAREFLVTGIRAFSETQGINFEATLSGKAKMVLQSTLVAWLLFALANWRTDDGRLEYWAYATGLVLIVLTIAVTFASGLIYLERARRIMRGDEPTREG